MVSVKIKSMFFDRAMVGKRVNREKIKRLSKGGAFIRRRARSSIRASKNHSKPGEPVKTRGKQYLKRNIFFSYDKSSDSVVVGPAKLNMIFFDGDGKPLKGTVPEVLEKGGTIQVFEVFTGGPDSSRNAPWNWKRVDLRSRRRIAGRPTRLRKVKIASRPTMQLALNAELGKAPELFKGLLGPGG